MDDKARSASGRISALAALALLMVATACTKSPEERRAVFMKNGRELFEKKDYGRAAIEFRNAVQLAPDDAEPAYQLARAHLAAGDQRSARFFLHKATTINPGHKDAQLLMADLMIRSGRADLTWEAERRARSVVAGSPDSAEALNALAFAEWRLGRGEQAETHLKNAIKAMPQNLRASVALAEIKLNGRDWAGAEGILKEAVRSGAGQAAPLLAMGELYILLGKPDDAERSFSAALKIEPANARALLQTGVLHFRAGRRDAAEQAFRRLSELPGKEYRAAHAAFLFQTGRRDDAIREFKSISERDPGDRDLRSRLVAAYAASNHKPEAEKVLAAALQKNAKDIDALFQRSSLHLEAGRFDQAEADLKQILGFSPSSAQAHFDLARVFQARGEPVRERPELEEALRLNPELLAARIRISQLLLMAGAADSALEVINQTPEPQRKNSGAMIQRNWALLAKGDYDSVRRTLEILPPDQSGPELLTQDALVKLSAKQNPAAEARLTMVLNRQAYPTALEALAGSYLQRGQKALAVQKIREYSERYRRSFELQLYAGRFLASHGETGSARQALNAALHLRPASLEVKTALARLDIADGNVAAAKKAATQLVASHPGEVQTQLLAADIALQSKDNATAIQHYRKAAELRPDAYTALNNLAYLLADQGQPAEALKFAERARELAPEDPAVADTLGWILHLKGLHTMAVPHLEMAVRKDGSPRNRLHLGEAYLKAGQTQKAMAVLGPLLSKPEASPAESTEAARLLSSKAR